MIGISIDFDFALSLYTHAIYMAKYIAGDFDFSYNESHISIIGWSDYWRLIFIRLNYFDEISI